MGASNLLRRLDLPGFAEPMGKGLQRVPGGELVIIREPPLGSHVQEELVDGFLHGVVVAGPRPYNARMRRATSSALARLLKAEMRKYPSPWEPNPLPGVMTTWAWVSIRSNISQLDNPLGVPTQM